MSLHHPIRLGVTSRELVKIAKAFFGWAFQAGDIPADLSVRLEATGCRAGRR